MLEGFFSPGGIEIEKEYLNGTDVAYIGGITKFFNWYYGGTSHLKFNFKPVLSVTKLEEETAAGTWTTRTESTDYIVVDDGVRYVTNTPAWKYKNVRATYKAGYKTTPVQVQSVSARLAATLLQRIVSIKSGGSIGGLTVNPPEKSSLTNEVFTDEMKRDLKNYVRLVVGFA